MFLKNNFSSLFIIPLLLVSSCSCPKPLSKGGKLKNKNSSPTHKVSEHVPSALKLTKSPNELIGEHKDFQLTLSHDGGQKAVVVADYVLQIMLGKAKDELDNPVSLSTSSLSYTDATNTLRTTSGVKNNLTHFTTKKELTSSSSIDLSFTLTPAASTKEVTIYVQLQRTGKPTVQTVELVWRATPSERITDKLLDDIRNLDLQDPITIQQYEDLTNAGGKDGTLGLKAFRAERRVETKRYLLAFLEKIKNGDPISQDNKKIGLIDACMLGHLPTLQLLLDMFPEVDIRHPDGTEQNLLASARTAAVTRLLLKKGLDPNYIPPGLDVPAFEECAREGNIEAIRCMVREGGADLNQTRRKAAGHTATITLQNISLLDTPTMLGLLELGADATRIANGDRQTILHYAAERPSCPLAVAQALLEKAYSLVDNQLANTGNTALHIAAAAGNTTMTELLLNKRANTNIKNNQGYTALQMAVLSDKPAVISLLLRKPTNAQELEAAKQLARDNNNQAILDLLDGNA